MDTKTNSALQQKPFELRPSKDIFRNEFAKVASKIRNSERFIYHARAICVDEKNYLGLFALDTVLQNRLGKYRKDSISPAVNHQADIFFQLQNFHEKDKANPNQRNPYLPDKPHLDKVLAWLHDEGEDIIDLNEAELNDQLDHFLDNINHYVTQHNKDYPELHLPYPTAAKIKQMRSETPDITEPFDLITKSYKGETNLKGYYEYHGDMLGDINITDKRMLSWHARACRVKSVDKPVNASTFAFRSKDMIAGESPKVAREEYRKWCISQITQMRDIYIDQNFSSHVNLKSEFNIFKESGFTGAAILKFPESSKMLEVMRNVSRLQLKLYTNDLANEGGKQGSPRPSIAFPQYSNLCLSPRVNLLSITSNRLDEVTRIDALGDQNPKSKGMFDVPFHSAGKEPILIPLSHIM